MKTIAGVIIICASAYVSSRIEKKTSKPAPIAWLIGYATGLLCYSLI